jgi:4-amino-4-deoxy-L-arabinose transferase-like glycosyltransferase
MSDQVASQPLSVTVDGRSTESLRTTLPAVGKYRRRKESSGGIAKPIAALVRAALAPGDRLTEALSDPARRHSTMIGLATIYGLVWWLYAVIAKSSQDIHTDLAETVALTYEWALGYPKHPPFLTWLVSVWFAALPLADWAYYLLAGVSLGLALYLSFMVAGEWLDGHKRALVPLLLSVIPFYNFLALKYDHNAALIPLWAFTIWAFMRSLDTRHYGWGILTGLGAAAACLTKYW